jgi:hypothetical protein
MNAAHFRQIGPDDLFEVATSATSEGQQRRDQALTLLESRRAVFIRRARRAFLGRLLCAGSATADDVREAVELPPGVNPNLFGAVPTLFARLGIVRFHEFDTSRRPARHAGVNRVWRLADAGAAADWLDENPDLPDPEPPDDDRRDWSQRLLFPIHANTATPPVAAAGAAGF